jgi:hypothetical protein
MGIAWWNRWFATDGDLQLPRGEAMLTDYTLTDADSGRVLPVADGFVVNLKMTKSGPYDQPSFSEATQQFTTGRFVLRGSGEFRNLCCIDAQGGGGWASHYGDTASVWSNASVGYRGELMVVCVPRGSIWELSLSDVPFKVAPVNWFDALAKRVADQREAILVGR